MKSKLAPLTPLYPSLAGENQLSFHGQYHGKGVGSGLLYQKSGSHYILDWLWEHGQITLNLFDINFFIGQISLKYLPQR